MHSFIEYHLKIFPFNNKSFSLPQQESDFYVIDQKKSLKLNSKKNAMFRTAWRFLRLEKLFMKMNEKKSSEAFMNMQIRPKID